MSMTLEYHLSNLLPYIFYGSWPVILLWEILLPARKTNVSALSRWSGNIGLYIINILLSRWSVALLGASLVAYGAAHGLGLAQHATLPAPLLIVVGVLLVDLSTYGFHVLSHKVHWLWRLHRVHHNDPEVDLSTNFRHHPLESIVGTLFAAAVALVAGFPPETVLVGQLLSLMVEPLSHSNVRLPGWLENPVRLVFVTPDMHVVHHSADKAETNSNYGGIFSFWDRIFGTYVAAPARGYGDMQLGLEVFRDIKYARLPGALAVPFLEAEEGVAAALPASRM